MKNSNVRKLVGFIGAMFLIAFLFSLSFTFVVNREKENAKQHAKNIVEKEIEISIRSELEKTSLDSLDLDEKINQKIDNELELYYSNNSVDQSKWDSLFTVSEMDYLRIIKDKDIYRPWIFFGLQSWTFAECQESELKLGLDLQGGMNATLEVSTRDILIALSKNSSNEVFNMALDDATKKAADKGDYLDLFFDSFDQINSASSNPTRLANPRIFGNELFEDDLDNIAADPRNPTDEEVAEVVREKVKEQVNTAFEVLRARIDKFGVASPTIQKNQRNTAQIIVELPGVKDEKRVKKLLQSSAVLEFWETYSYADIFSVLLSADASFNIENKDALSEKDLINELNDTTVNQNKESFYNLESTFDKISSYSWLRPSPYDQSGPSTISPIVGSALEKDTAKVTEYLNSPDFLKLIPTSFKDVKFLWDAKSFSDTIWRDNTPPINRKRADVSDYLDIDQRWNLYAIKRIKAGPNKYKARIQGEVESASQGTDPRRPGRAVVNLTMTREGSREWSRMTSENIGKCVAIALDDYIYTAPTVQGQIDGGRTEISGDFTIKEAVDLANILQAGKLPIPATIKSSAVVGPSMGLESVNAGYKSFLIALVFVLCYMIFYYMHGGFASNIALVFNMLFIFGAMAGLGGVLTLPGIAGIVLTIGMSVDANVLIFERIREELKQGKGLTLAIRDGYSQAYSSIIDANITTLLTGVVLFYFGTGPIKGFATTLIIGILTSLFCAIFITRLIFESRISSKRRITFSNVITNNAFKNTNISFLSHRKKYYFLSALIIVAGIISLSTKGLNTGIDFEGGRTYIVSANNPIDVNSLKNDLSKIFISEKGLEMTPEIKTFGSDKRVKIATNYKINNNSMPIFLSDKNEEIFIEDIDRIFNNVSDSLNLSNSGKKKIASWDDKVQYLQKQGKNIQSIKVDDYVKSQLIIGLDKIGSDYVFDDEQLVGPSIAEEIKTSAFWSVLFSLILIFVYILIRFKKWQYSLGAVLAVFHDVLILLSIFSIFYGLLPFSLEVDQAFIAAILTVIGYSLNDTVVVFDRIREYTNIKVGEPINVINDALNSTLSRTINTSLTTFFVLLIIFLFGGEVIKGFMFAIMIGVLVGTYSSLFIASPIMYDTVVSKKNKK